MDILTYLGNHFDFVPFFWGLGTGAVIGFLHMTDPNR